MKRILPLVFVVVFFVSCVNPASTQNISPTNQETDTPIPTLSPTSTPTFTPTPVGSGEGIIYFAKANKNLGKDELGSYAYDICSIRTDGTNLVNLTNTQDKDIKNIQPAVSPNGKKIAFAKTRFILSSVFGNHYSYELYMMNIDGTEVQKLSSYPQFNGKDSVSDLIYEGDPTWSPDGSKLAFISNRHTFKSGNRNYDNEEIYILDFATNEITKLTTSSGYIEHPTWSPDGKEIAFMSNRTGTWNIFVINSDGSGKPINITNNKFSNRFPAWSPVEDKIVFHSDRDGNVELYTMKSDGSEVSRLTNNPATDASASWSPDGKWIAFFSDRSGYDEIYLLNLITNETIQLTKSQEDSFSVNWRN